MSLSQLPMVVTIPGIPWLAASSLHPCFCILWHYHLCLCVPVSSHNVLRRTHVIGFRTHSNPAQLHLNSITSAKTISSSHIHRYQGQNFNISLYRHNSTHNIHQVLCSLYNLKLLPSLEKCLLLLLHIFVVDIRKNSEELKETTWILKINYYFTF